MTMNTIYIPERFTRVVATHVAKNLMSAQIPQSPLILGIHGPSGCGKTFQCEHILRGIGAKTFLISGGQLESKDAGEPANLIRRTYINAGYAIDNKETKTAVILMNDVDTGLGDWGQFVQTTVNRQAVFGELMHLVDYPTIVDGKDTKRIPIIMTGNDFTKLYEPLVRAGRMTAFEWLPNLEEQTKIVSQIFREFSEQQCTDIIQELEEFLRGISDTGQLQTAFFTHLRATVYDDVIWAALKQRGIDRAISEIAAGHQPKLNNSLSYEQILRKGKELITSGQLINHLRGK